MATVKIYSTESCPFCKMEKDYLTSKGIAYENIFVEQHPDAAEEVLKISGQLSVPVTVINDDQGKETMILGFDRPKIDAALNLTF